MKTLLTILIALSLNLSAQDKLKPSGKVLRDTTINNAVHKLYEGSKGGKYIIVVSKTTGKEYKRYISKSKK